MRRGPDPTFPALAPVYDRVQAVTVYVDDLQKTIGLATALTSADRKVDLAGLEHTVGVLCAKALDLMPEEGRILRPTLIGLTGMLDTLMAEMDARKI